MITLIITGSMIVLLNGLLVVLLANQNNKIKRELEIYKNRLDNIDVYDELKNDDIDVYDIQDIELKYNKNKGSK